MATLNLRTTLTRPIHGTLLLFVLLLAPLAACAEDGPPLQFAPRFEAAHTAAVERARRQTNDATTAWELGRASFDLAEFATNNAQRAPLAEQGIAACRRAIALESNSAPAHYYLALNYGQLARVKLFSALGLLDQMESAFLRSITIDPHFDYAGAHRALGLLYRDAPGWPTSLGSRKKARVQLEKAVELHPEYPGNRLNHLDSLLQWGEKKTVQSHIPATDQMLKTARTKFSGEGWAFDWHDWDRLWKKISAKVGVIQARSPERRRPGNGFSRP
jgi:tetratricopeptide (TPR) repeat protein